MSSTIVPMGSFAVRKKSEATDGDKIISPGAQTCLVVVLESNDGVGVAHIDSPLIASDTIINMVSKLRKISGNDDLIEARIYGGDYGNPLINSTSISQSIYDELDNQKVRYEHKDYQLTSGFIMALATMAWGFSFIGPESKLLTLACIGLAYKSTSILKTVLPERLQPRFLGANIDVSLDINTGLVSLIKDDETNTTRLLEQARGGISSQLWRRISERPQIDPKNPENKRNLAMIDLS